jgi:hypothetical protein
MIFPRWALQVQRRGVASEYAGRGLLECDQRFGDSEHTAGTTGNKFAFGLFLHTTSADGLGGNFDGNGRRRGD